MRNPFVAMAMAVVAAQDSFAAHALAAFKVAQERPTSYAKKTGLTVAAAKRAAIKAKNRAHHRAACRG